mgnify:CR=1 FL=1|tara:strand:- start:1439 stop:1930 length:492 start_codon:yes stop_codon:yes gene_type:complete
MHYDDPVMIRGLVNRTNLNNRFARIAHSSSKVSKTSGLELRACQLLIGEINFWCPEAHLVKVESMKDLERHAFHGATKREKDSVLLYMHANEGSQVIPDVGRVVSLGAANAEVPRWFPPMEYTLPDGSTERCEGGVKLPSEQDRQVIRYTARQATACLQAGLR